MLYITSLYLIYFIPGNLYLLIPFPYLLLSPPLSPLVTTNLFSVSMSLVSFCYIHSFVLVFRFHIYVKTYSVYFSLTYFTKHNALQVHPCCCKWQHFIFLWLSNIPLYIYHIDAHYFQFFLFMFKFLF